MAKIEGQLKATSPEEQLLSKQAVTLPPRERLGLLLNAKYYPIVKKGTSAKAQIREMIDFYNLCCLMLRKFFPNEEAEENYVKLVLIQAAGQENNELPISNQMSEAFKLVRDYEEFERKIEQIRELFYQYGQKYPELYDEYNLEDIVREHIPDMLDKANYMVEARQSSVEKILKRWELL